MAYSRGYTLFLFRLRINVSTPIMTADLTVQLSDFVLCLSSPVLRDVEESEKK